MRVIEDFIKKESSSGIILIFVTLAALLLANSPFADFYQRFLETPVSVRIGALLIDKSLLLWINDGLMAVFFLLVGLEVKRELIEGQLSSLSKMALPSIAAFGGLAVPALIYVFFNKDNSLFLQGWAIPTATDIAFALGILSLLGKRVPSSLKIFLVALAILDDLSAIVIIAFFYTADLSLSSLAIGACALLFLFVLNRRKVRRKMAYILLGLVLWVAVLKSGVHATLAGVALAFTIPLYALNKKGEKFSPCKELERDLHYWVAFLVLPAFAFVNAGVSLQGLSIEGLFQPVPLGIAAGLFFGKQIGVFCSSFLAIRFKLAKLPEGASWSQLYGVSILTGIGFTMSLFINSLAFESAGFDIPEAKLAILLGSFFSAVVGLGLLRLWSPARK